MHEGHFCLETNLLGRKGEKGEKRQRWDSNPGCLVVAAISTEQRGHHSNQPLPIPLSNCTQTSKTTQLYVINIKSTQLCINAINMQYILEQANAVHVVGGSADHSLSR